MCLGIPGQVIRMLDGYEGQLALVDVTGEARKVNVGMLPEETFEAGDDGARASPARADARAWRRSASLHGFRP